MSRGILDMLGATVAFVLMLTCVKLVGDAATSLELVFWRNLVGALVVLPLAWSGGLGMGRPGLLGVRTVLGTASMTCYFLAARHLPLAETALIQRMQPVLVALLARWLLGAEERAEGRVWGAFALGIAGAVLLVVPDTLSGSPWALAALAAAVLSSGAHLTLRVLGRTERPSAVVFWFQAGGAVLAWAGASFARGGALPPPDAGAWPAILGVAVAATAGQLLMTRAYQRERAAPVAAASYVEPLLALLPDALIFGLVPGWDAAAGGTLIVAAGALLLFRGRRG